VVNIEDKRQFCLFFLEPGHKNAANGSGFFVWICVISSGVQASGMMLEGFG
jgi:hypothetical protein